MKSIFINLHQLLTPNSPPTIKSRRGRRPPTPRGHVYDYERQNLLFDRMGNCRRNVFAGFDRKLMALSELSPVNPRGDQNPPST